MISHALSLASVVLTMLSGCSRSDDARADSQPMARDAGGACADQPAEEAVCGSADWCAEHGVPESKCVQCNPDAGATR